MFISLFIAILIFYVQDFKAAMLFLSYEGKRPSFRMRTAFALGGGLGITLLINSRLADSSILLLIRYSIFFILIVLSMWICFDVTLKKAFYAASFGKAIQHLANNLARLTDVLIGSAGTNVLEQALISCIFFVPICMIVFVRLIKGSESEPDDSQYDNMRWLSAIILVLSIGVSRLSRDAQDPTAPAAVANSIYASVCCVLCLSLQYVINVKSRIIRDNAIIRQLRREENQRFHNMKEDLELFSVKYHDIRQHMNERFQAVDHAEIEQILQTMDVHGILLETSNSTLNIVLAERAGYCRSHHIKITFMGDGSCLNRISEVEVHSLFSNALSNAIRACEAIPEEKRTISILVRSVGSLISINIRNYYDGVLSFDNGNLITSKAEEKGYHGYGIRSMQMICQSHGGDIAITVDHQVFDLLMWMND